jgi:type I restriction enzyme, S subunit
MNRNLKKSMALGAIADFCNGGAWSQSEYANDGIPVVRVTDIKNETVDLSNCKYLPASSLPKYKKHLLSAGDLVICTVGSHPTQPGSVVGRAAVIPPHANGALLNQNAVRIRSASPDVDQVWLGYLCRSRPVHDYIMSCAQGAANQVRMAIGLLKEMPVEVPPLQEQRRISSILSAYDDLIDNNQRRIKILEEMARTLYREWFVEFRFPGQETVPREPSALGNIPKGWVVKKLGDILELKYGKALKKEERREGNYPVYGSSGIVGTHDTSLERGPGIIVGRKGNVGSVFWCDEDFFVIDTAYFVTSSLPLRFLFYVLPTLNFINSDSAVPGLSRNQAYTLEILVPPAELLKRFCELAEVFEQQAAIHRRRIRNLQQTRDLLLPRLVSGELDVSDIRVPQAVAA